MVFVLLLFCTISIHAQSWETPGYVQAANQSTELLSYTFTDHKPAV